MMQAVVISFRLVAE